MLRDKLDKDSPGAGIEEKLADAAATSREEAILCTMCGHVLTRPRDRVERFGAHVHDRVNPAGIVFRICLFVRVEGGRLVGPPSDEFAWFPKYHWRIAICGNCRAHIGWRFSAASDTFFGLSLAAIEQRGKEPE